MAMSVADYTYIMSKGTVVYESTPDKLIDDEHYQSHLSGRGGVSRSWAVLYVGGQAEEGHAEAGMVQTVEQR